MRSPVGGYGIPALRAATLATAALCIAACGVAADVAGGRDDNAGAPPAAPKAALSPSSLVSNGRIPFEGILTGGQPTGAELEVLAKLGYGTIINLRLPEEEGSTTAAQVESLGMSYVAIPIAGAEGINEENARRLAGALEGASRPVLVHCASGNRAGAIFGLKARLLDGKTPEESLAVARAAGVTGLEPALKELLGLAADGDE